MANKVRVAVFDAGQRAIIKKCEITDDGSKIRVKSGGKAHFMPEFDNTSYLEFKRPWYLGGGTKKLYFVRRMASKCVNFQVQKNEAVDISMPDPKQVMDATDSNLIKNFSKEDNVTPWYIWVLLLILLGIALKVFGVIV